jgi:hypothetical protein
MREDREVDLSPCIESVESIDPSAPEFEDIFGYGVSRAYRLVLRDRDDIKVRPAEITEALFGIKMEDLTVIRTRLYGWKEGRPDGWRQPL